MEISPFPQIFWNIAEVGEPESTRESLQRRHGNREVAVVCPCGHQAMGFPQKWCERPDVVTGEASEGFGKAKHLISLRRKRPSGSEADREFLKAASDLEHLE